MRFESIELRRYGHFSGQNLDFERHDHDFHLIVGGNEAGKSTLRRAFHDLLFGIPMNSPMAFLHAGPELALNAVLAGEQGTLAMGRRRKRNGGLVDADEQALAPEVLARWLGGITEAFYERMFGLDHRRLEQGSRAMLQAGDDVDSVLFQAAAGLAALNGVLGALREEAASLWTPHHSRSRAWYAASDRLKEAEKLLKAATVRPTAWAQADREYRRLDDAYERAREEGLRLRAELRALERLRRLAPLLAQMRECENLLGDRDDTPGDGSPLLVLEADLLGLEETRLRVAGHRGDIEQCNTHIGLLRADLGRILQQLGRASSGGDDALDTLAAGLPSQPQRHDIGQLLVEGRELRARRDAAVRGHQARLAEADELRARIEALPDVEVGQALRRALEAATAAGDIAAMLDGLRRKAAQEAAELASRLAALRQPGLALADPAAHAGEAVAWLSKMSPWPAEALVEHAQRRRQLQAELDMADKRARDAGLELDAARLKTEQFRRAHQAVSREEVMAARGERDALWRALATGQARLVDEKERYAGLVLLADVLADRHLEAVDDAARLQALEHECERLEAAARALAGLQASAAAALHDHEAQWRSACAQRQLPNMAPPDLQGWLPGRDAVLLAHQRLQATDDELALLQRRHDALLLALGNALDAESGASDARKIPGPAGEPHLADGLPGACEAARALLQRADRAAAQHEALAGQLARLEPLLPGLEQDARHADTAHDDWLGRRRAALERAGLPQDADDAYVEAAIALLVDADALLERLRERKAQRARLDAELRHFAQAAARIAERLAESDFNPAGAEDHVAQWVARLVPLRAAAREREQARQQLAGLQARLLEEAEGRDRKQVEAELAALDLSSLAGQADALGARLDEAEHLRDRLAVEREQSRVALDSMSGADEAAQAEARRQEALADMGEVAERYVRVYTQYRLLEHITERYRERSQGPLLAHAGRLFAGLTLGAHEGLVVDGDAATLWARRADGRLVPLDGLSDGTRDQLYLALRLAALALYLDSATPLPFIADDLFVNYDDGRALAGLRQLSEVSRRSQVIFLTHHQHIVELAREGLAGRVQIIELPGALS